MHPITDGIDSFFGKNKTKKNKKQKNANNEV